MRRAIARHKLKHLKEAKDDLELLLKQQSRHKKAKELYEKIQSELAANSTTTKRRLKIEEVTELTQETKPSIHVDEQSASHDAVSSGSHDAMPTESHDAKSHDTKPESHDTKPKSHDTKPESHDTKPSESHNVPLSDQTAHVIPLPVHVIKLKDQGNKLFQKGQYGEALDYYSNAINSVQKSM